MIYAVSYNAGTSYVSRYFYYHIWREHSLLAIANFLVFICHCFVVLRTLTGHKSSVRSMDFHPYGNYVATGSTDTNIKVRIKISVLLTVWLTNLFRFVFFTAASLCALELFLIDGIFIQRGWAWAGCAMYAVTILSLCELHSRVHQNNLDFDCFIDRFFFVVALLC